MAATDPVVTIAGVLKWNAPDGDVLLSDGGIVKFDADGAEQDYNSFEDVFGSVLSLTLPDSSFEGEVGEGRLVLIPAAGATLSDWWRTDLENTRIRCWSGELDADGVTMSTGEIEADMLVDGVQRLQDAAGSDQLVLTLMDRARRLFLVNEGNVCSDRFHQSIWSGERGFENCHDGQQYFAWGAEAPSSTSGAVSGGGGVGGGGSYSPTAYQVR